MLFDRNKLPKIKASGGITRQGSRDKLTLAPACGVKVAKMFSSKEIVV